MVILREDFLWMKLLFLPWSAVSGFYVFLFGILDNDVTSFASITTRQFYSFKFLLIINSLWKGWTHGYKTQHIRYRNKMGTRWWYHILPWTKLEKTRTFTLICQCFIPKTACGVQQISLTKVIYLQLVSRITFSCNPFPNNHKT